MTILLDNNTKYGTVYNTYVLPLLNPGVMVEPTLSSISTYHTIGKNMTWNMTRVANDERLLKKITNVT